MIDGVTFGSFTWSYASWIGLGILAWLCFAKLWLSYRESGVTTVKYFGIFFAHMGLFFVIMGLPAAIPGSLTPEQLGAFYIFGHIFLYSGFAYYSRIPLYIWKPEWEMKGFALNLVAGAVITYVNLIYWNTPELADPITILHVQDPVGPMIGILAIANWIIGGTLLFGKMALNETGTERIKLFLLAAGLLMISIAGPLHDLTTSFQMLVAADVFTFLGILLLMAGIYFRTLFGDSS